MAPHAVYDKVDSGHYYGSQGYTAESHGRMEPEDALEPVAVVGIALRFPQDANNVEGFWQMLLEGRSALTDIPPDRWNIDAFYHENPDRHDTMNVKGGHFLSESVALFDAPFFSVQPSEAACMDPMQRMLLEETYHALENAGIPISSIIGSDTSVHVGCFSDEYDTLILRDPQLDAKYMATGTGTAMLSNRISWFFDLHGPSLTLDTACSSSLYALHLAVQGLRSGESSLGIVAGSNLMLNPETNNVPLSNLGFLSPDSKCHSFDEAANGYARGEGTAVLILKTLKQALKDNDTIRAVIRGTGSNQDGRTPSITQPSQDAQQSLLKTVYANAGLDYADTGFFEAHGTGTKAGDPKEANAISTVFHDRKNKGPLVIGAVKTNIGHLEGVSGLAGLIKSILVLETAIIPPNIWFNKPNPDIKGIGDVIDFPRRAFAWPNEGLRRASVNSFGYGGANAHAIIDDAYHYLQSRSLKGKHVTVASFGAVSSTATRLSASKEKTDHPKLLVFSASDEQGVQRLKNSFKNHLIYSARQYDSTRFANLAYTLAYRRSQLPWKAFVIARTANEAYGILEKSGLSKAVRSSAAAQVDLGFIFTGQGAQWYSMGRELFRYQVFEDSIRKSQEYLQDIGCKWKLMDELMKDKDDSSINDPRYAQPICAALQIALVALLSAWGLRPSTVVGHSSGEIAAAFAIGALSQRSALRVAYYRGALSYDSIQRQDRSSSMMAVAMSEYDCLHLISSECDKEIQCSLAIGCINSPSNVTITGDAHCLDELKKILDAKGTFARILKTGIAYHSSLMQSIASEYKDCIGELEAPKPSAYFSTPSMFSSVSGSLVTPEELRRPEYWVSNLVQKVRFSEATSHLCASMCHGTNAAEKPTPFLVEVGPTSALRRPVREILEADPVFKQIKYGSVLVQDRNALESSLELVGQLYSIGRDLDLLAVNSPGCTKDEMQVLQDLPCYPFNHANAYWMESERSKNFRFRKVARHDLLGLPDQDHVEKESKWRHVIRIDENPWIMDHKFDGSVLYPAAGMLAMAIEGVRQINPKAQSIQSYRLEEIQFLNALLMSSENGTGIETRLYLRPASQSNAPSDTNTFKIFAFLESTWVEICRGTIAAEFEEPSRSLEALDVQPKGLLKIDWRDTLLKQGSRLDSKDLYDNLRDFGIEFGPTFRTLRHTVFSEKGCTASSVIDPQAWAGQVPKSELVQDHVIHPTALDALFQVTFIAASKGTWDPIPTMVPFKAQRVWISNDLLHNKVGKKLDVNAALMFTGFRDKEFTMSALDRETNTPKVVFQGYTATAISSVDSSMKGQFGRKPMFNYLAWKPDIDLLSAEQICTYLQHEVNAESLITTQDMRALDSSILGYIMKALENPPNGVLEKSGSYLSKYYQWMIDRTLKSKNTGFSTTGSVASASEIQQSFGDLGVNLVGSNLHDILHRKVDPVELLAKNSSASGLGSGSIFRLNHERAAAYISLLTHKTPAMRILQLGASTDDFTAVLLNKLSDPKEGYSGELPCSSYTLTDSASEFLDEAKSRFKGYGGRLNFQTLDIENSPSSQGFDLQSFDLIVASTTLHKANSIDGALSNVRSLLRPGAQLVLIEPTNLDTLLIPFTFGILPSWWSPIEGERKHGPLLSDSQWKDALERCGFSSNTACVPDFEDQRHTISVIIASMPKEAEPTNLPVHVMIDQNSTTQTELANLIQGHLQDNSNATCDILPWDTALPKLTQNCFCIVLAELDEPVIFGVQEAQFQSLKSLAATTKTVLWVTKGREQNPRLGLATGLGRTLSAENPGLIFIDSTFEVSSTVASIAEHVASIYLQSMKQSEEALELEYKEQDGVLSINRLVEAPEINDKIYGDLLPQAPKARSLEEVADQALKLSIRTPGLLDSIQFEDDPTFLDTIGEDQVEITVQAVGVNFKDIIIALGQFPANTIGLEGCGIISAIGSRVPSGRHQIGDKVCFLGPFKNRVRVHYGCAARVPDHAAPTDAASVPLVYCTAYYALNYLGRLRRRESVLIHSGAGGVGQAAIQLALTIGATIYTTVGSSEKKDLLLKLYPALPEDHIWVGRGASFVPWLKEKPRGGVDVVLNSYSGNGLRSSLDCVLPFGRFLDISKTDMVNFESISLSPFTRNITYSSIDLSLVIEKSPFLIEELLTAMAELFFDTKITPPQPVHVYQASQIEEAYRYLQSGKNTGKAAIAFDESDQIQVVEKVKDRYSFDSKSSYVIVGGLGGLGRSIASWMIKRGARNLILLSRSGLTSKSAQDFIQELASTDVRLVAPSCDVTNEDHLRSTIEECARTMPPIKGCIQGAMVIRDGLFENMPFENWRDSLAPKVEGTINLDKCLPTDMDFFVLLASGTGVIGARGQSNYASGNTFQDAFAAHLTATGRRRCVSLDLGLVLGFGIASTLMDVIGSIKQLGYMGIREAEFHAMLDHLCDPHLATPDLRTAQLVTGIEYPRGLLKDSGFDDSGDWSPWVRRPLFRHLVHAHALHDAENVHGLSNSNAKENWAALLSDPNTTTTPVDRIMQAIQRKLARALSVPEHDIEAQKAIHSFGVDSLVAIEVRSWLSKEGRAEVSIFEIMGNNTTVIQLATLVAERTEFLKEAKTD